VATGYGALLPQLSVAADHAGRHRHHIDITSTSHRHHLDVTSNQQRQVRTDRRQRLIGDTIEPGVYIDEHRPIGRGRQVGQLPQPPAMSAA